MSVLVYLCAFVAWFQQSWKVKGQRCSIKKGFRALGKQAPKPRCRKGIENCSQAVAIRI